MKLGDYLKDFGESALGCAVAALSLFDEMVVIPYRTWRMDKNGIDYDVVGSSYRSIIVRDKKSQD
jgi:hypothetical protein